MKKEIPICLICDEKYPFAVMTALISALENIGENSFYKIFCLIIKGVNEKDKENLLSLQDKYSEKCSVELINIDESYGEDKTYCDRVSNACRYKFLIGKLIPDYEKILYLDADIVVRGDLSELYETDISEYYVAGVFSYNHYLYKKKFLKILDIPDMKSYINAGVLLLNLDKIRENEFQEQVDNYTKKSNVYDDQHILNKICYGKIKFVSPKYNMTLTNYRHYKQGICEINYTKEEVLEAAISPVIFHYTGMKSWEYDTLPFADEWLKYYNLSPYKNIKLKKKSIKIYKLKKWISKKIEKICNIKNKYCPS